MAKGWKTIIYAGALIVLGVLTYLQTLPIKEILFPALCDVPANAQIVADECTGKIMSFWGAVMAVVGVIVGALRTITTTSIFKSLKDG